MSSSGGDANSAIFQAEVLVVDLTCCASLVVELLLWSVGFNGGGNERLGMDEDVGGYLAFVLFF